MDCTQQRKHALQQSYKRVSVLATCVRRDRDITKQSTETGKQLVLVPTCYVSQYIYWDLHTNITKREGVGESTVVCVRSNPLVQSQLHNGHITIVHNSIVEQNC